MSEFHTILNARNKKNWETPKWLVRGIERYWKIRFTLDACGTQKNKKAPKVLTYRMNALLKSTSWGKDSVVWLNPPYGEEEIPAFLVRALHAIMTGEASLICALIPNATENGCWEQWVFPKASEICFIHGRVSFVENGKPISGNTKGSVLVFFSADHPIGKPPKLSWVHRDVLRNIK